MTHNFYKINEYFKEHEKNIYNGITSAKVLPKQIQKKPPFFLGKRLGDCQPPWWILSARSKFTTLPNIFL